jgi:anti-sigma factor RsiW
MECIHRRRLPVKEPRSENERLSALLDGRLDERERGELLAHLSAADEEYRVFADTASILRELEEAEAGAEAGCASSPEGIPLRLRRAIWRRPAWSAIAASVALFA